MSHLDRAREYYEQAKKQGFKPDDIPLLTELIDKLFIVLDTKEQVYHGNRNSTLDS